MRLIYPGTITDAVLTASSLSEDDTAVVWSSITTYNLNDEVYDLTTHRVYKSSQGSNLNKQPVGDDGTWWVEQGATNKWKVFDTYLADPAVGTTEISWDITVPSDKNWTRVAVFGPKGVSVNVTVVDSGETETCNKTVTLEDPDFTYDWESFWLQGDEFRYRNEIVFEDVLGEPDSTITVKVTTTASAACECGQIVVGVGYNLGFTVDGTDVSIEDYSKTSVDAFGRKVITKRDYAKNVKYQVAYNTDEGNRLLRLLGELRATPVVYYVDANTDQFGTTSYGYFTRFRFTTRAAGKSDGTIDVAGLT